MPFDFTVRRGYNTLNNTSARRRLYERGQDPQEAFALLLHYRDAGAAAVQPAGYALADGAPDP